MQIDHNYALLILEDTAIHLNTDRWKFSNDEVKYYMGQHTHELQQTHIYQINKN